MITEWPDDIEGLEKLRAEFIEYAAQIKEEMDEIKADIDCFKADVAAGAKFDMDWYRDAMAALRRVGSDHQGALTDVGEITRRIKDVQSRAFERRFVNIAKQLLPAADFIRISTAAAAIDGVEDAA
jgi:hypothetical protein